MQNKENKANISIFDHKVLKNEDKGNFLQIAKYGRKCISNVQVKEGMR